MIRIIVYHTNEEFITPANSLLCIVKTSQYHFPYRPNPNSSQCLKPHNQKLLELLRPYGSESNQFMLQ